MDDSTLQEIRWEANVVEGSRVAELVHLVQVG